MSAPPASRTPAPQPAPPPRDAALADLLAQVGHGSQAAFEEFYQGTAPSVFGLISLMLGSAAAPQRPRALPSRCTSRCGRPPPATIPP